MPNEQELEQQVDQEQTPAAPPPAMSELEKIRAEDPEFPEVQARVLAKARGETFDPAKHMPSVGRRRLGDELEPAKLERMDEILAGWIDRGHRAEQRGNRYLRLMTGGKR